MPSRVCVTGRPANDPAILYCGREWSGWKASPFGQPYRVKKYGRGRCIELYRSWLWGKIEERDAAILEALRQIREDSALGCWCPLHKDCHCDVIIRAWQWCRAEGII